MLLFKMRVWSTRTIRTLANSYMIRTLAMDNLGPGLFGPLLIWTSVTGRFGPRKIEVRISQLLCCGIRVQISQGPI